MGLLPKRLVDLCDVVGFHDIAALEAHFDRSGTFKDLPGVDDLLADLILNLITTLRSRQDEIISMNGKVDRSKPDVAKIGSIKDPNDPHLEQLAILFNLSVRAFNVCQNSDLLSLSKIRAHLAMHGEFKNLRNCGTTTQVELKDLLNKAEQLGYFERKGTEKPDVEVDDQLLEEVFLGRYNCLSQRAKNILLREIGEPTAQNAIKFFMEHGRKMERLPGAGTLVMRELREMRSRLLMISQRNAVICNEVNGSSTPLERWFLANDIAKNIQSFFHDPSHGLTALKGMAAHLRVVMNGHQQKIYLPYLQGDGKTGNYQELAKHAGLSRERVRQLMAQYEVQVPRLFRILYQVPEIKETYPELVCDGAFEIITQELWSKCQHRENADPSPLFLAHVITGINEEGLIIGDWFKAFERSDRTKYLKIFEPFVIRRDISEAVYRLCKRLNELNIRKRMVEEEISLDDLPITGNAEQRSAVLQTGIALLLHHSSEVQQYDNALILPPNKRPKQHLLLQRVLEAIDEPGHATIIQSKWNELYPDTPVTIEQIRAIAIRDPLTFFSIGRTSTYGLKRWENEREHLKGGTIRDIVEEVLSKHDVPLHLDDLLPEVKKFRPGTNAPSVRDNLYLDRSGRFKFFPGNFIGLRSRAYEVIPDPVIRVSGSFFRHSFLRTFVGRNFSDLIDHVSENSAADRERVESSLKELIHGGRLILDPNGVILHAPAIPVDKPDMKWTGELPFEHEN